jgi:pimeloyl-ACP methyl ester carboxylesterase
MTTGFSDINNTTFYYEMAGEGRPLVLVHAGICDSRMWDEQFHVFAQTYRVIRYDRRGFGRTPMVDGPYSHHQDLYDLLKFLGVKHALLLGCSQGGKTIIDLTLEHPEMMEALILVASALGGFTFEEPMTRQWQELEEAAQAVDVARVNELELQIWVDGPGQTPERVDTAVRELVREMNLIALSTPEDSGIEESLEPAAANRLDEIHVPTLVVIGDLDTPRTIAAAELLAKTVRGAQKLVMPGTAHLPNMEQPAEFNRQVLSFLNQHSGA